MNSNNEAHLHPIAGNANDRQRTTKGVMMQFEILRLPGTKRVLGYRSDESVRGAVRAGLFTTGVSIGQRSKGWPDYEVRAIAAARIAGQSDDQIRELVKKLHADRANLPALLSGQQPAAPAPEATPATPAQPLTQTTPAALPRASRRKSVATA